MLQTVNFSLWRFPPQWGGCGLTCGLQLHQLNGLTANKTALVVMVSWLHGRDQIWALPLAKS